MSDIDSSTSNPPSRAQAWLARHPSLSMALAFSILFGTVSIILLFRYVLEGQQAENYQSRWAAWFHYLNTDTEDMVVVDPPPFVTNGLGLWVANPTAIGVNTDGFRSPEFSEPRGERPGVMIMGASFTWGYSARPIDESFVDHVRNAGYHTYNMGIPASQPFLEADIAEEYVPRIKPDVVLIMHAVDNRIQFPTKLEAGRPFYHATQSGWLPGYTHEGVPITLEEASVYQLELVAGRKPRPDLDESEKIVRDAYERIERICAQNDVKCIWFVLPSNPKADYFQRVVEAKRRFVDKDLHLPENFGAENYAGDADLHFNNRGHAVYGAFIVTTLKNAGISPEPIPAPVPYPYIRGHQITADRVATHFGLDSEQRAKLLEITNALKDKFLEVYQRQPVEGGKSPFEHLVELRATEVPNAEALFDQYATERHEPETHKSYFEAFNAHEMTARESLHALLRPEQSYWMADFPVKTLHQINTGYGPFGDALDRAVFAAREVRGLEHRYSIELLRIRLRLNDEQVEKLRDIVSSLKHRRAGLLLQPSTEDMAPLQFFSQKLSADPANAGAAFLAFTDSQREKKSGKTFNNLMTEQEAEAARALTALLSDEQRALLRQLPHGSLADIPTGEDPVGDALRQFQQGITPASPESTPDSLAPPLEVQPL